MGIFDRDNYELINMQCIAINIVKEYNIIFGL